MQQSIRSANMTFMLQRKITFPVSQQLKIMTELEEDIPKSHRPQDNFKLAQITIFTEKQSYEGKLTGKSIAKQLSWNSQSFNTLLECLMGKREKLQMKFFPAQNITSNLQKSLVNNKNKDQIKYLEKTLHHFQIVCEISSGINLTLFTVQMEPSNEGNPFFHMMKKFSLIQHTFREKQKSFKQKQEYLKSELNQIEAVQKQIIDSSSIEINLMKKEFIKHVNNEKAKIRKLMGTVPMINPLNGLIQNLTVPTKQTMKKIVEKQQNDSEEESKKEQIKNRVIKKVDRQFYQKRQNQKMEIQSQQQSKFSSQSSNNNENNKNQHKKQQIYKKNVRKFTEDQSSSDDQVDQNGNKNNTTKEKTFLQEQRQKMQNAQVGQNDWDALFN